MNIKQKEAAAHLCAIHKQSLLFILKLNVGQRGICFLNASGVIPLRFLKSLMKDEVSGYPQSEAISDIGRSVVYRSSVARAILF